MKPNWWGSKCCVVVDGIATGENAYPTLDQACTNCQNDKSKCAANLEEQCGLVEREVQPTREPVIDRDECVANDQWVKSDRKCCSNNKEYVAALKRNYCREKPAVASAERLNRALKNALKALLE